MVTRDDRIKVTDFGIARVADNTTVTATNAVMGSVHYFSPEQARGAKVDNRSDIYSLGIVLFEMLTGTLPFDADNPVSVALMQVQSKMPKPSDIIKNIDPSVDAIVLKMTEKDPNKRYSDVFDLIKDIKDYTIGSKTFTVNRNYEDDKTVVGAPIRDRNLNNRSNNSFQNSKQFKPRKTTKKKSTAPAILGVFSALFIIALLIYVVPKALNGMKSNTEVEKVVLEEYVGKTREEAKNLIESQGLVLDVSTIEDEDQPDGIVLEQNPEAGLEVEKGSTVRLTINELPDSVAVPPLKGLTLEEAKKILEENSLRLGSTEEEFNEEVESGKIISSNPEGGYSVKRGSAVKVLVSKGIDNTPVTLNDYTGLGEKVVVNQLKTLGFDVEVEKGFSDKVSEGQVYAMEPSPGKTVEKGSKVTIYISEGSKDEEDKSLESTTEEKKENEKNNDTDKYNRIKYVKVRVPDDGDTHNVTAERVVDASGNKISPRSVWNYNIEAGDTSNVELIGPGEYNIYVDGNLVKTEKIK